MEASTIIYSTAAVIGTLIVALFVGLWLPGIERKFVHAQNSAENRTSNFQSWIYGSFEVFFQRDHNS